MPVSLIIDDSTCLVNLAHFAIPQFHEVFPDQYHQPWKTLPREIPDAFVRRFGEWCAERGIKGKYSLVPYPACVGWLDRDLPGWSSQELKASLDLVRTLMMPNWDIHPEMVSHTWVIDTKTGRPYPDAHVRLHGKLGLERRQDAPTSSPTTSASHSRSSRTPESSATGSPRPVALAIVHFRSFRGARWKPAAMSSVLEIPHYFRHLFTDEQSVAPRVELAQAWTARTPSAWSRSSAARATGSAAGTGSRPARSTSSSRPT